MTHLRLREIRLGIINPATNKPLTQGEFASGLNLKTSKIRDIENQKQKLTVEIACLIEDKYDINLRWLLTGRGEKDLKKSTDGSMIVASPMANDIKDIVDLLQYANKPLIDKIKEKLQKFKESTEEF